MIQPSWIENVLLLMRVDKTKNINEDFEHNRLTFSCAANWLDYVLKEHNQTIGDLYECIFAHLKRDDPRIHHVKNSHGEP